MQELFQKNNTDFDHLIEKYHKYHSTYTQLKEKYTYEIEDYLKYTQRDNWDGHNEKKVPLIYYYAVLVWLAKNQVDLYEKTQQQHLDDFCLTARGNFIDDVASDRTYFSVRFNFDADPVQIDLFIHDKVKIEYINRSILFDDEIPSEIVEHLGKFLH